MKKWKIFYINIYFLFHVTFIIIISLMCIQVIIIHKYVTDAVNFIFPKLHFFFLSLNFCQEYIVIFFLFAFWFL